MIAGCGQALSKGHEIHPQLSVLTKDEKVMTVPITLDDERLIALNMMRAVTALTQATLGVFVSEGWGSEFVPGSSTPPSEAENRFEVLLVVRFDGEGTFSAAVPIRRSAEGRFICLDDTEVEFNSADGAMISGVIPRGCDYSKVGPGIPFLKLYLKTHGVELDC